MEEVTVQLAADSPEPFYRQIVDQVRAHVERGALRPGDALPSVRSLATQLGVHFNTIADAYRELGNEGLIELRQGKRAIIRSRDDVLPVAAAESEGLRQRLRHLLAEMRLKGVPAATIAGEVEAVLRR